MRRFREGAPRGTSSGALACVLGGLDVVSPLGRAGIRSAVAVPAHDPVRWSRHVVDVVDVPAEWEDDARCVDLLVRWALQQDEPPVLYYPTDGCLLMVSRARDTLTGPFRLVLPDAELVEDLVDKARFSDRARAQGLPVPASVVLTSGGPLPDRSADLRYPLVVKPVLHRGQELLGFAGKAISVASGRELVQVCEQAGASGLDLLAQELVPGPETCIESYHAYVDEQGVVAEFTGRKLSTHPARFGLSTLLTITDDREVRAEGRRTVEALALRGVCKIDYKRGPDSALWLLEVNARFNLWHNPGAAAGVNLPALVHADLTGGPRPPGGPPRPGVTWVDPVLLRRGLRAQGRPTTEWLSTVTRATTRSTGDWNDPWPLLGGLVLPHVPGAGRLVRAGRRRRERSAP